MLAFGHLELSRLAAQISMCNVEVELGTSLLLVM